MIDREKVINGLECHKRAMYGEIDKHGFACNSCPFKDMETSCHSKTEGELIESAIALLKAQEPKRGRWIRHTANLLECPVCGKYTHDHDAQYCSHCGAAMMEGDDMNETDSHSR